MKAMGRLFSWIMSTVILMTLPVLVVAERRLAPIIEPSTVQQPQRGAAAQSAAPQKLAPTLEERVARIERTIEGQGLTELLSRLDQLQQEVQSLRGLVEIQSHNLESIEQRQRDLYLDSDRRLSQLETAATQAPAVGGATPVTSGAAPVNVAPETAAVLPADPAQEQSAYETAFGLLKDGRYNEAITAFRALLARYPAGKFSDNAQYWLGEAHYVTRRFPEAVIEFNKVLSTYPKSAKLPDAMLKLGYTYYELADWAQARKVLEEIVVKFPQATAARMAEQRLQKFREEGH